MSLELWNTFATFGTFIVIAATAIAALVQLRHARLSNQIAALNQLNELSQTPEFLSAQQFVNSELAKKLEDPAFRYQIANRRARTADNQPLIDKAAMVGNFYEGVGLLVKIGVIDRELAASFRSNLAPVLWENLAPVTAIIRQSGDISVWENFEYITALAQDWLTAHPRGDYPTGVRRITIKYKWLEADRAYAASRAPA